MRALVAVCLAASALLPAVPGAAAAESEPLFEESFNRPDGLVTNAYATQYPNRPDVAASDRWAMDAGSLYARDGAGWTGVPDTVQPDAGSERGTGSATFRLTTQRTDFGDVALSLRVRPEATLSLPGRVDRAFDGVHLWLRKRDAENLYFVSLRNRTGSIAIKKKCSGGDDNGGTYRTLAWRGGGSLPFGEWTSVRAEAVNLAVGVRLRLWREGDLVLEAFDPGVGCLPHLLPGAVGVRGDATAFSFDDLRVDPASLLPLPVSLPSLP